MAVIEGEHLECVAALLQDAPPGLVSVACLGHRLVVAAAGGCHPLVRRRLQLMQGGLGDDGAPWMAGHPGLQVHERVYKFRGDALTTPFIASLDGASVQVGVASIGTADPHMQIRPPEERSRRWVYTYRWRWRCWHGATRRRPRWR